MTPRQNRVDPWGDLNATPERGLFTGNRGCLVDDDRRLVRHHRSNLWIICLTSYRGWWHPLDEPRIWTPLFFLDDAVALAAGHRPCGLCRRDDHRAYRSAVERSLDDLGLGGPSSVLASELNRRLARERLRRGGGVDRAKDRRLWTAPLGSLPVGTVVVLDESPSRDEDRNRGEPHLVSTDGLRRFGFGGWSAPVDNGPRREAEVAVLTPPTSVAALTNGFEPTLHPSAQ